MMHAPPPSAPPADFKAPPPGMMGPPPGGMHPVGPPFTPPTPGLGPPIQVWPGGGGGGGWGDGGGGPMGPPGPPGDGGGGGGGGGGGDGDKQFALWTVDVDHFGTFESGMQVNAEQNVQQGDQDTLKQEQDEKYTAVLPCLAAGASGRVTVILPDGQKPSDGKWQSSQQPCPANPSGDTLEPVGQAQDQAQDQQQPQPSAAGVGQMWFDQSPYGLPYGLPPGALGTYCCSPMGNVPLHAPAVAGSPCYAEGLGYGYVR